MDLYTPLDAIRRLEAELPGATGADRPQLLVTLAFGLRQHDTRRALAYVDEAEPLVRAGVAGTALPALEARLDLVRAEASALFIEFAEAETALARARDRFGQLGDAVGLGDTWLAEGILAKAQGQREREFQAYGQARTEYARAEDAERERLALGWALLERAFSDPAAAAIDLAEFRELHPERGSAALNALLGAAEGKTIYLREPARSAVCNMSASEVGRQVGLIRHAIICALNSGSALQSLSEFEGAAEAYEWAAARARETGWPTVIGASMRLLGDLLRDLGQLERARELLEESVTSFASTPGGINKAATYAALGHTLFAMEQYPAAVTALETAIALFREAHSEDNLLECLIVQTRVLSAAGRPEAALKVVAEAQAILERADYAALGIDLAQALADLHRRHRLATPPEMNTPDAPTYFLEDALRRGRDIGGWLPSAKLLMALGEAWYAAGNPGRAFDYAKQAIHAEQREETHQASQRATLMHVRHETERARAESEHHRQLAATLAETSRTLDQLGRIGQQITANLETEHVFEAIYRHLGTLVDATHLSIWMLDESGDNLQLRFGVEDNHRFPPRTVSLASRTSKVARVAREKEELLFDAKAPGERPQRMQGTREMVTALFGPLLVGNRLLGVLSIQSPHEGAYAERERLIFKTLCAYGAIALDNAHAYRRLQQTQTQLQEALLELEEASLVDPLTGLKNRRFLLQHFESDIALSVRGYERSEGREQRKDADLILFLVDIDHFKQVNDTYGHAAGDAVLLQTGQRFRQVFRESDYLVRWGGEEFLIVARGTQREQASRLAERIRSTFSETDFVLEDGTRIHKTCSIGYAPFPFLVRAPRALSWLNVVDVADIALYLAKRAGRDGWVGLEGTSAASATALLDHLKTGLEELLAQGELQAKSNRSLAELRAAMPGQLDDATTATED